MANSFLDYLADSDEEALGPVPPRKKLASTAPGASRGNAIALPGIVATARSVTRAADRLEKDRTPQPRPGIFDAGAPGPVFGSDLTGQVDDMVRQQERAQPRAVPAADDGLTHGVDAESERALRMGERIASAAPSVAQPRFSRLPSAAVGDATRSMLPEPQSSATVSPRDAATQQAQRLAQARRTADEADRQRVYDALPPQVRVPMNFYERAAQVLPGGQMLAALPQQIGRSLAGDDPFNLPQTEAEQAGIRRSTLDRAAGLAGTFAGYGGMLAAAEGGAGALLPESAGAGARKLVARGAQAVVDASQPAEDARQRAEHVLLGQAMSAPGDLPALARVARGEDAFQRSLIDRRIRSGLEAERAPSNVFGVEPGTTTLPRREPTFDAVARARPAEPLAGSSTRMVRGEPETIREAATRDTRTGEVVAEGPEHGYTFNAARDAGVPEESMEHGWVTSRGRFVDRVEGRALAESANQVRPGSRGSEGLISEDFTFGGPEPSDLRWTGAPATDASSARSVRNPGPPERIVRAAIRDDNGQVHEGTTHGDAMLGAYERAGADINDSPPDHLAFYEDGFVTDRGRFVSKAEAANLARASGQVDGPLQTAATPQGDLVEELGSEALHGAPDAASARSAGRAMEEAVPASRPLLESLVSPIRNETGATGNISALNTSVGEAIRRAPVDSAPRSQWTRYLDDEFDRWLTDGNEGSDIGKAHPDERLWAELDERMSQRFKSNQPVTRRDLLNLLAESETRGIEGGRGALALPPGSAVDRGAAALRPMTALAGAGLGAAGGAVADPEHPTRGALIGGALGFAGGAALPEAARSLSRDEPRRVEGTSALPSFETRGGDLGELYHGGESHVMQPNPGRVDSPAYGTGFYAADDAQVASRYGGRVTHYAVRPEARVLNSTDSPRTADPALLDDVSRFVGSRRLRDSAGEPLTPESIRGRADDPFDWHWIQAVDAYADAHGYDILRVDKGGGGNYPEYVIKNPDALRAHLPRDGALRNNVGAAHLRAASGLAGAGIGAAGGAAATPDDPRRGALAGGLVGLVGGVALPSLLPHGAPREWQAPERTWTPRERPDLEPSMTARELSRALGDGETPTFPHRTDPGREIKFSYDPAGKRVILSEAGRPDRAFGGATAARDAREAAVNDGFRSPTIVSHGYNLRGELVSDMGRASRQAAEERTIDLPGPRPTPGRGPKAAPLPLPPMHPDLVPAAVEPAWRDFSARHPRIAARVAGIVPMDPRTGGAMGYDADTGLLRVPADEVALRRDDLAHEGAHVAQDIRGQLSSPYYDDMLKSERYAQRAGRAKDAADMRPFGGDVPVSARVGLGAAAGAAGGYLHDPDADSRQRVRDAALGAIGGGIGGAVAPYAARTAVRAVGNEVGAVGNLQDLELPPSRGRFSVAAISLPDGRYATGPNHAFAADDALLQGAVHPSEFGRLEAELDPYVHGFITPDRRFLDRAAADAGEGVGIDPRSNQPRATSEALRARGDLGAVGDDITRAMRQEDLPRSLQGGIPRDLRTPPLQRAYLHGISAGESGLAHDFNNFPIGTPEWRAAERGWNATRPRERAVPERASSPVRNETGAAGAEAPRRFVAMPAERGKWRVIDSTDGSVAEEVGGIGAQRTAEALAKRYDVERGVVAQADSGPLAGSRVVDENGVPKVVYHGTSKGFGEFDPAQLDPDAQYGPGYYFTENPAVAGDVGLGGKAEFGYATPREGASEAAPNVRPARLGIRNPFDIDATYSPANLHTLLEDVGADPDGIAHALNFVTQDGRSTRRLTGDDFYEGLSEAFGGNRAAANAALRKAGYDGITHIGGGNTGTDPHRVWIAFDRPQIRSAFGPAETAAQTGSTGLAMMRATGGAGLGGLYGYATGDSDNEASRTARALGFAAAGAGLALAPEVLQSIRRVSGNDVGAVGDVGGMADPERALYDALNKWGRPPAPRDLAALASGEMEPDDFARTYGVSRRVAKNYAEHVRTLSDPEGYRSPLDSDEFTHDRPEREPFAYQQPPEAAPVDGVPDDGFLPSDAPPRKYGAGQGQTGMSIFTPEGVTTVRRAAMLMNAAGRIRDVVSNAAMGASETSAELIGAGVDALVDYLPGMRGQRTMAFNPRAVAKAAYEGVTAGSVDMVRSARGLPRLHRSAAAAAEAASASVEGAERVVMSNPVLDAAVRVTGRFAGSVDSQAAVYAYEKSIASQARTIALNERIGRRATRAEAAAMEARLRAEPTDEMKVLAASAVAHATFTNESAMSRMLAGMREATFPNEAKGRPDLPWARAGLDFIAPFRRVPGAVAGKVLEYSPLGAAKMTSDAVRLYKLASAGADPALIAEARRSFAMTTGRVGTGATTIALGAALGEQGLMTGVHLTQAQKDDGARPFSIKIAGRWWPLGMMGPTGAMLAVGAELHSRGTGEAAAALGENVADATLMRGMGDVRAAVSNPDKAGRYAASAAASFVPPIVGQVARIIDPVQRKPDGVLQTVEARIPFASRNVPARTDNFGREVRETASLPGRVALALFDGVHSVPSREGRDAVQDRLTRMGVNVGTVRKKTAETEQEFAERISDYPEAPHREDETDAEYRRRAATWDRPRPAETDAEFRQRQRDLGASLHANLSALFARRAPEDEYLNDKWTAYRGAEATVREAHPNLRGPAFQRAVEAERRKVVASLIAGTKHSFAVAGDEDPRTYLSP